MSTERYTTERSTLEKSKPEWGGALVGHHHHPQNAYFPRHQQQQNMKQSQHAYVHHPHHLVGGCLDNATFQPDAGVSCSAAETAIGNPNSNINDCHIQNACRFNPAANVHVDVVTHTAAPAASHQASQQHFSMPALESSTNDNNQKISVVATKPRQARTSTGDQLASTGISNVSTSTFVKAPTPRRMRNTSMAPLTVRPTGTKDRHSKVRTAKGLRDRRVRLSAPTAIQFFDVQDRLGYDQPSKAVDWLIKKARAAIDELAPVEGVIMGDELSVDAPARDVQKLSKDRDHSSSVKVKDEEQSMTMPITTGCDARAESRAKARERARERAKEKCIPSSATATATASAPTSAEVTVTSAGQMSALPYAPSQSPNLHLLPEFFLLSSQVRQQIDGVHRPSNLSGSMLTPPTSANPVPHLLPFSSHLFPGLPISSSSSSFIYPGDAPPFQLSVPPIVYNNNNTPISPRGTLQSIFSNPAKSSVHQAHLPMPPLMMMGALQAHAYGAAVSAVGGSDREGGRVDNGNFRQSSAELGSPDLHHHSRIPMRIHGMELDAHVEENRMTQSSMQADFH